MALKKAGINKPTIEYEETPEVPDEIKRDFADRPLIVPLDGGTPIAYTRASTLGKAIEDDYHLNLWRRRTVAFGLSRRPDLVALVASVATNDGDDRKILNDLCDKAHDAAKGDSGANIGTALHKLSERRDTGEDLTYLPPILLEAMDAYAEHMDLFDVLATETFVVCDQLQAAGSFDRVVRLRTDLEFFHRQLGRTILPAGTVLVLDLKGLALDTPLPTPTGWTTMGAVRVGDEVIGSDGRPCQVTAKSRTKQIGTYVVTFDDGEKVICDREHLWWVRSGQDVKNAREQVIGVKQMRDTLFYNGQRQHRVPVTEPLDLPEVDLPIDPYLFGCWLGDGKAAGGEITKDAELFELFRADGHECGNDTRRDGSRTETRTVYGLRTKLRVAGLLGHRVIPDAYLRGSIRQRVALLRGLMDTDGTWNQARQRCVFDTTDKALAEQVRELCLTLGLKPQFNSWTATGFGKTVTAYGVEFSPVGFNPFRLRRKAERVTWTKNEARARHRIVKSVEPGPDVETACIAVDSPNSTYLCGLDMVPTHNTGKLNSAKYWGAAYGVQQTVYACGQPYRPKVGRISWEELLGPGVRPSTDWALILHVPGDAPEKAGLVMVDLELGAGMAELAVEIREARKRKGLLSDAHPVKLSMTEESPVEAAPELVKIPEPELVHETQDDKLLALITSAKDDNALTELWDDHQNSWTDRHIEAAKERLAELTHLALAEADAKNPAFRFNALMADLRHAQDETTLNELWEANQDIWTKDCTRMVRARLAELAGGAA